MLVQQQSADSLLAFADKADYRRGQTYRRTALEGSRLLPLREIDSFVAKAVCAWFRAEPRSSDGALGVTLPE